MNSPAVHPASRHRRRRPGKVRSARSSPSALRSSTAPTWQKRTSARCRSQRRTPISPLCGATRPVHWGAPPQVDGVVVRVEAIHRGDGEQQRPLGAIDAHRLASAVSGEGTEGPGSGSRGEGLGRQAPRNVQVDVQIRFRIAAVDIDDEWVHLLRRLPHRTLQPVSSVPPGEGHAESRVEPHETAGQAELRGPGRVPRVSHLHRSRLPLLNCLSTAAGVRRQVPALDGVYWDHAGLREGRA